MVLEKGVKGMKIRKARYYVSDTLKPGFKVHPAFVENGNVNPYIYLAAFEGSLFDTSANAYILDNAQVADFAADKLSSIAGTKPAGKRRIYRMIRKHGERERSPNLRIPDGALFLLYAVLEAMLLIKIL